VGVRSRWEEKKVEVSIEEERNWGVTETLLGGEGGSERRSSALRAGVASGGKDRRGGGVERNSGTHQDFKLGEGSSVVGN